jgi:hypothetical protein
VLKFLDGSEVVKAGLDARIAAALKRPFSEATLFRIASAYEAATKHRIPPPDFGPVSDP